MDAINFMFVVSMWFSHFLELLRKSAIDVRQSDTLIYKSGPRHGKVWGTIFVLFSMVGFFVDPMFFYIWNINDNIKCFRSDKNLQTGFLVLRCAVDLFYFLDYLKTWSRGSAGKVSRADRLNDLRLAYSIACPWPQVRKPFLLCYSRN